MVHFIISYIDEYCKGKGDGHRFLFENDKNLINVILIIV